MSVNQQINMYTASSSSANWRFTLSDGERKTNVKRLFVLFEVFNINLNVNQRFTASKKWEDDAHKRAKSKYEYNQTLVAKMRAIQQQQLQQKQRRQQQQNQQTDAVEILRSS
ncbi:hypothetical protein RhiirA4_451181 [Rhizophagus irregularis]|uniref:Uncharacterized protein n=1 Tax=Rhizophagus irregularis TaxID=588596 RepID=A0A2I1FV35_9GLOM|nr:hypothetical protein RhiirA4_451181 [Rhizophagus irregularis]